MADFVAPYLEAVLEKLPPDRTLLVAHSLGAQVALSSALGMDGEPRKGLLLIQGAVPAASILTYIGRRNIHRPTRPEPFALRRCAYAETEVEVIEGRARFASSIRHFRRLVITQTDRDRVLRGIFTTDEIIDPRNFGIPLALPDLRQGAREQPALKPIGSEWKAPIQHYHDTDVLDVVIEQQNDGQMGSSASIPKETMSPAICETINFTLDHPDAVLLPISAYRKDWRPAVWHSPHYHAEMRAAMIDALLAR